MRARSALLALSIPALSAALLTACGTGDDNTVVIAPSSDAGGEAAKSDGGSSDGSVSDHDAATTDGEAGEATNDATVDATTDATTGDGGDAGDAGDAGNAVDAAEAGDASPPATLKHIFYIMMENHGYAEIIANTGVSDAGGSAPDAGGTGSDGGKGSDGATSSEGGEPSEAGDEGEPSEAGDEGDVGDAADSGVLATATEAGTAVNPAPYINSLATKYGLAQNYYGVTHPSLPNYLAAISGDFQGIWDDCAAGPNVTCAPEEFVPNAGDSTTMQLMTAAQAANAALLPHWFPSRNIVDQLEENDLTWTAYMQSIAAVGDTSEYWPYDTVVGSDGGATLVPRKLYAQKHDPFMYFTDIRQNSNRMQRIVPFTQLATDLAGGNVPNFVWISPDQCDDMHGVSTDNASALGNAACGGTDSQVIALGDAFLQVTVPMIMASPAWTEGSAIVIVWDEDDYSGTAGCCKSPTGTGGGVLGGAHVPAIVISSKVGTHLTSTAPYNHYSLLATIQHIWGFDCLANTCGMADGDLMTKLFLP